MGTDNSLIPPAPATIAELRLESFLGPADRYQIKQVLGRGGFGTTYLAYDRVKERDCVVKQLTPKPNWNEAMLWAARQSFRREIHLLITLSDPGHAHIPNIYDVLEASDCLVMEYIEGANLQDILQQRGPLPVVEALGYVRDVCEALSYMHGRAPMPIVHRDVKPENIMLTLREQHILLIDFGLAKDLPAGPGQGAASVIAGTPGYAPIEQWRGAAEPRSDVYALAGTLFTLLTNLTPPGSKMDVLRLLQEALPTLPSEVRHLIAWGMAEEAEERPSAQTCLEAIDEAIASLAPCLLRAPDGAPIVDMAGLVAWCEAHWQSAVAWLYGELPNQAMAAWGKSQLVDSLHECVRIYRSDWDAGLDMALALLDPEGFGTARPALTADKETLDFDTRAAQPVTIQSVIFTNNGRRYVRAYVERPHWISLTRPMIVLIPGQCDEVRFQTHVREPRRGGRVSDVVDVRQDSQTLVRMQVRMRCRSVFFSLWTAALGGLRSL